MGKRQGDQERNHCSEKEMGISIGKQVEDTESVLSVGMCTAGYRFPQGYNFHHDRKRSKVILPNNNLTSQQRQPHTFQKKKKSTVWQGERQKTNSNSVSELPRCHQKAQVSSCSIIKHLIAQSKIVKQYCMVVLWISSVATAVSGC